MNAFLDKITSVVPTENQWAWQQLEFTAFFHYGINSFTDCEWGTGQEDISVFNPHSLNTDQWCESIRKAGMKACILTAKHHDGFCLWDTKYTEHSIMHTPLCRDIVGELSASCQKYGLKLGIYLSPWDRHEKTYGQGKPYDDFFCSQLTELMTRYGELYTLWFDGACGEGPNGKRQVYDWERYYALIRQFQPKAVISVSGPDVRWCGNEAGDCRESEWSVVPAGVFSNSRIAEASQQEDSKAFRQKKIDSWEKDLGSRSRLENEPELIWYPAEVDTSIRPGWFYHEAEDEKVRPLEEMIQIYLNSVGGNGLLLLNIPPHRDGYITPFDAKRLEEIGQFIKEEFSRNLLDGRAQLSAPAAEGHPISSILRADESYWEPEEGCEECFIRIKLPAPRQIKWVVLQEQIRCSQRIERFEIRAECSGKMEPVYASSTVGYKKICRLEKVCTDTLELHITAFRKCPTLKFIGIY